MDSLSRIKLKQRAFLFGGLGLFLAIMVLGMWMSDPNKGKPSVIELQREKAKELKKSFTTDSTSIVSAEEVWIQMSEKKMAGLQAQNSDLTHTIDELKRRLDAQDEEQRKLKEQPAVMATPVDIKEALPPPPVRQLNGSNNALQTSQGFGAGDQSLPPPPGAPIKQEDKIEVIELDSKDDEEKDSEDKASVSKNISHYLPTGSFGTAVLLSGVDAPTGGQGKSNPMPVLLRLMDNGQLPNYFNSEIKDCHVIGATYGDLSSERAYIRLETLTCVLTNGDVIEEGVKGYVAGEDGKAGLRGKLVSKQGSVIAKSMLAGMASGAADVLKQQNQSIATSPLGQVATFDPNKTGQTALAGGASTALEKISDFYIARANEMYPIIEVDANRIGEIILTGGTDLKRELIGNIKEKR